MTWSWVGLPIMAPGIIPDHLTCLLNSLYVGQKVAVRIRHETTEIFKIGNGT